MYTTPATMGRRIGAYLIDNVIITVIQIPFLLQLQPAQLLVMAKLQQLNFAMLTHIGKRRLALSRQCLLAE